MLNACFRFAKLNKDVNGKMQFKQINSNTLAISCKELTRWKRPWCWEGLGTGGEGDDRGWDGWMASPTRWAWVWINSRILWWTGRPGVLQFMGSQSRDTTERLNWTDALIQHSIFLMAHLPSMERCKTFKIKKNIPEIIKVTIH